MILETILFVSLFHHKPKPKPLPCPDGQVSILSQGGRACSVPQDSKEMMQDKKFVIAVEDEIPSWHKDEKYFYWERVELASVEADCAMAHIAKTDEEFYAAVKKLRDDYDVLCALDIMLHKDEYI